LAGTPHTTAVGEHRSSDEGSGRFEDRKTIALGSLVLVKVSR
jgi:hypothetical protein